jgi:hypothetical protein
MRRGIPNAAIADIADVADVAVHLFGHQSDSVCSGRRHVNVLDDDAHRRNVRLVGLLRRAMADYCRLDFRSRRRDVDLFGGREHHRIVANRSYHRVVEWRKYADYCDASVSV